MQPWIPNEFGRPPAVSAGNARSADHRTSEPRCATNNNHQHNNIMKITSLLLTLAGALAALTFVTTEVQAAGPPGAAPLPAGNITATTAEISGRFTANGADTDIYLELSENGAPFKSFYAVSIEGPFVELLLPFTLTSLKANVRYTYRFRVSNAYGTNTSASL